MIKSLERENGCFAKAAENEPLFVLRAQDALAPIVIRLWADLARNINSNISQDKINSAVDLAAEMEEWPNRKWPD